MRLDPDRAHDDRGRLRSVERRRFLASAATAGIAGGTVVRARAAQPQAQVRWRMASSFPKSLDMLFGSVVLSAADRLRGYAAEFEPVETTVFQHVLPDMRAPWGVGANMAMRRRVIRTEPRRRL